MMNKQKQYFINGMILIVIGLVSVTIAPYLADKFGLIIEKDPFVQMEFFMLTAGAIFYLFSPKYYKWQVLTIISAILYYFLYIKIYPLL